MYVIYMLFIISIPVLDTKNFIYMSLILIMISDTDTSELYPTQ